MEMLLEFFSDLILFTAGLIVLVVWALIIIAIAVEIYDQFTEKDELVEEEEPF